MGSIGAMCCKLFDKQIFDHVNNHNFNHSFGNNKPILLLKMVFNGK
jgi:hypothetical protein